MNFPDLTNAEEIAFDTETTGLQYPRDEAFGFSVAVRGWAAYFDIRRTPKALDWFQDQIDGSTCPLVGFNVGFDVRMLAGKIEFPLERLDDAGVRATLIDEHRTTIFPWTRKHRDYSLDSLAETELGERKDNSLYQKMADIFGGLATRNVQIGRISEAPIELVEPYAIRDAELTLNLYLHQIPQIEEENLHDVCDFERRTIPHVIRQEMAGIRVDIPAAEKAMDGLADEISKAKRRINKEVGKEFNVNSTPQIREYFQPYETEPGKWCLGDGTPCGTTDTGNPSINNAVLQSIKDRSPVAAGIIEIRNLIRTRDTFLKKHVIGHEIDGRVYPTINQVASEDGGTKTGRFSYVDPALQQIPNRNKAVAAIVKPCFLPDEGHVWLDCDLNSFEVRVFAHLVGAFNAALVETFAQNPYMDFHAWVADLMGVPRNPTPEGGANAKQLNLSMIFNSGRGSIANQLKLPVTESSFEDDFGKTVHYFKSGAEGNKVIDAYHRKVPGVKKLADRCKNTAEKRGWIRTEWGRRIRFPRGFKSYKASGLLIQSTAADINKENWGLIDEALDGRGRLMLNTHDSYGISAPLELVESIWDDVRGTVERDVLRVPLILDKNGVGENWWKALGG